MSKHVKILRDEAALMRKGTDSWCADAAKLDAAADALKIAEAQVRVARKALREQRKRWLRVGQLNGTKDWPYLAGEAQEAADIADCGLRDMAAIAKKARRG